MSRARTHAKPDHRSDHIYIAHGPAGYKIGRAGDVAQRMRDKTMNPDLSFVAAVREPNAAVVEKRLHEHFESSRNSREWFHETDEVVEWVQQFCSNPLTATRLEDVSRSSAQDCYPWDRPQMLVDECGQTALPWFTDYRTPIGTGTGQTSAVSEDWYTPTSYVEAARDVFGGIIDLDPMTCIEANNTVRADRIFTAEVNGLHFEWHGNVFLNPPWGSGINSTKVRAVRKALSEYGCGNAKAVILVLNSNAMTSKWFAELLTQCDAVAIPNHRVKHYGPGGRGGIPNSGTVFVYLGRDAELFIDVFKQFGTVVRPVATGGEELASDEGDDEPIEDGWWEMQEEADRRAEAEDDE